MNNHVVIWTVQRTGSTTLANILELLYNQSILHEPFNSNRSMAYKRDKEVLIQQLKSLQQKPISIKHCWNVHSPQYNQLILNFTIEEGYRIILLYRENALAREISSQLAKQTGVWGQSSIKKYPNYLEQELLSLNIKQMKKNIETYLEQLKEYKNYLIQKKVNFFEVSFEDLFENSLETRLRQIKNICQFIGVSPENMKNKHEEICDLLMNYRQNGKPIYQKIPNIKEIQQEFSNYTLV